MRYAIGLACKAFWRFLTKLLLSGAAFLQAAQALASPTVLPKDLVSDDYLLKESAQPV